MAMLDAVMTGSQHPWPYKGSLLLRSTKGSLALVLSEPVEVRSLRDLIGSERRLPLSVYETEGHRFESCRARSLNWLQTACTSG
jgi:hypothetical protein